MAIVLILRCRKSIQGWDGDSQFIITTEAIAVVLWLLPTDGRKWSDRGEETTCERILYIIIEKVQDRVTKTPGSFGQCVSRNTLLELHRNQNRRTRSYQKGCRTSGSTTSALTLVSISMTLFPNSSTTSSSSCILACKESSS